MFLLPFSSLHFPLSLSLLSLAIVVCWTLCAMGVAWYCLDLSSHITYVTLADGRRQERTLPFTFRVLLPFAGNLRPLVELPRFRRSLRKAEDNIITAGFEGLLSGWEYLSLRLLVPIVFGAIWTAVVAAIGTMDDRIHQDLGILSFLGFALFYLQPALWLRQTIKRRQKSILRAMPFMIDLLTLSVEAGVDFMNALQRSIDRRKMDPLTEELIRVNHEIQLGTPRREALRNLAKRVDLPDMRSFAFALVQADELGVSIGMVLRIQSDQIRQKRFARAEQLANEAPVKMLFPLLLFIFPAVFIVLLGPILSRISSGM